MKLEELLTLYQKEKPQLSPRTIQKYKSIITMFARDAEINNIYINRNKCIKWIVIPALFAKAVAFIFSAAKILLNFFLKILAKYSIYLVSCSGL
jgi:hypothetical protein